MNNRNSAGAIDSHTILYGVFGDPVHHSKSPVMMNAAFREFGINAAYAAFHVKPDRLRDAVCGIRALGFRGVNVTIPHKVEVMNYLDEVDEAASIIGAVNTIVNENGRLTGYNTDGIGYVRSLKTETGCDLRGKRIVVIGAGGAARGVVYALAREGPASIRIANRTRDKAAELAKDMSAFADCSGINMEELSAISDADLLLNTTSVGMHPHKDQVPAANIRYRPGMIVSDLIYNPLETRWLQLAGQAGAIVHRGLGMFIYQGAYAFEYWTGRPAPVEVMREAVMRSLQIPAE
ncbi:shikimate dehydrogenase [Ferviditalea candida]|uniref:Shikimate dehydrogenase (NADP(+)) n=1 Tax=Ferviditalea candida TaxID=3108399 RepID=A0ABU5ZHI8_9BACL|nr:shikimate dehydrogenase [Paenibacillaceae bacterium T2]